MSEEFRPPMLIDFVFTAQSQNTNTHTASSLCLSQTNLSGWKKL